MKEQGMYLVADGGSTKIDWGIINDGQILQRFQTGGINPYFNTGEEIHQILKGELHFMEPHRIKGLYFYGAGCSSKQRNQRVEKAFKMLFPLAKLHIAHDLLAAARSLCKNEPGIASILGTGSNSCYYNGTRIEQESGGIGFILGDEGSGAFMGKKLIQDYFYNELPDDVYRRFVEQYNPDKDQIIDAIYHGSNPNRYLASYALFLSENLDHYYIQNLVYESLDKFFKKHIRRYKQYREVKIHFVGSVAYHFSGILKQVAREKGVQLGRILKKPLDDLIRFHFNKT